MIKAIFFDIDNTLVSHYTGQVPPSAREALKLARAKGIQCLIATGRHLSELDSLPLDDMEFDGYITLNGQLCYDADRKLSFGNPITGPEKDALIALFQEKTIPMMLIEQDRMYANFINDRVLQAQGSVSALIPSVGQYTGGQVYQAVAFVSPGEKDMLTDLLPGCQVTWWTELAVDVVPPEAGKVTGIKGYLQQQGLSPAETMAFGDGENDMGMLQFVGTGIAVGNAQPHVQAAADYVTSHIDADGIFLALKHFEII